MLNLNKPSLLLDYELPSGNIFTGPLVMLNVPRCGDAPQQGIILTDKRVKLTAGQRTELITKYETAGYSNARATALADSFVTPTLMRVGAKNGHKTITLARKFDEVEGAAVLTPHDDHRWVMYEVWDLAHLFPLNVQITDQSAAAMIDHQELRKGNWQIVAPSAVPGASTMFQNVWHAYGWSGGISAPAGAAWFATQSKDWVFACIPVGLIKDAVTADIWQGQMIIKRPRTVHDRGVCLAFYTPNNDTRSTMFCRSLAVGYSAAGLETILKAKGCATVSFLDTGGTVLENFHSATVPDGVPSATVAAVQADWPNMTRLYTKALLSTGDFVVSKDIFAYGWLDTPNSCTWAYDDIHVHAEADVTTITINPLEVTQSYSEATLKAFLDQAIAHGDYSAPQIIKLTESRDSLGSSTDAAIFAVSRPAGYDLELSLETVLPLAVKATDNGVSLDEVTVSDAPPLTVVDVALKARALKKVTSLSFMPIGDQDAGLFGNEVITFVGSGAPGSRTFSWSMTRLGVAYPAAEEEMMVATKLGAQWVLSACTEAEIADFYFAGATNRADANAWLDDLDADMYHDRAYRLDDYETYSSLVDWPAAGTSARAKLTLNQVVGDRANTAKLLFAMSTWSVGRRLRNTYITAQELADAEIARLGVMPAFDPATSWNPDYVRHLYSERNNRAKGIGAGGIASSFNAGTAEKVCCEITCINNLSNERIGCTVGTDYTSMAPLYVPTWPIVPTIGAKFTIAVDRSVPGANKVKLYVNGVFDTEGAIADGIAVRAAVEAGGLNSEWVIDTDPDWKPTGYSSWDTSL